MKDYLRLIRVRHWIKNIFVFVPVFFAQKAALIFQEANLILAFLAFCMAASIIYIFNDWLDIAEDQKHPIKKSRPLAAGKIAGRELLFLSLLLAALLFVLLWFSQIWLPVGAYILLNIAYSLFLKHIAIIDITAISLGFVLRIIAGGIAAGVALSHWLIIMTFLLAMCLALGKRRAELVLYASDKKEFRKSLSGYNLDFVNLSLVLLAATTLVFYLMYCMSEEVILRFQTDQIYITSIFVVLGLLRFFQIAIVSEEAGSPTEILLKDRFIQINLFCWILSFYFLIYY